MVRREIQKAGRDREVQHGADEDLAAADAIGEPAPAIGADNGADPGTHEHGCRLAESQLPRPDQEGEHEADQEVVEEFECIAENGGDEYPDLIAGQARLPVENLEHGLSLELSVSMALIFRTVGSEARRAVVTNFFRFGR